MTWWKKTSEKGTYMPIPIALIPMPRSSDRSPATFASPASDALPLNTAMTASPPIRLLVSSLPLSYFPSSNFLANDPRQPEYCAHE